MDHQVFAQLLGNYGEFVGAIGVVVTLIYLGVQIRQNTAELKRGVFQDVYNNYAAIRRAIYVDPSIGDLLTRASETPDQLSFTDLLRLENLARDACFTSLALWRQMERGLVSNRSWPNALDWLAGILTNAAAQTWWQREKKAFDPGFVEQVDFKIIALDS